MATKTANYLIGAGVAALGAYLIYTEYEKYAARQRLEKLKKTATPLVVLETLTQSSPTTGVGAKSVVVKESPEVGVREGFLKSTGLCDLEKLIFGSSGVSPDCK